MCTLDMGHFHPTEETYDKISSLLLFTPEIMLHVSRPVRWDSDHVVILNDSVQLLAQEIVWANALGKTNIGLDYFDASINRIGAYVVGSRATQKAFLQALLTPIGKLREYEAEGKLFQRMAVLEEAKSMPWAARLRLLLLPEQRSRGRRLHRRNREVREGSYLEKIVTANR